MCATQKNKFPDLPPLSTQSGIVTSNEADLYSANLALTKQLRKLSEALAVARSGLVAADKEIRIIAADNLIEHYPLMDIARETITQIDNITGGQDE